MAEQGSDSSSGPDPLDGLAAPGGTDEATLAPPPPPPPPWASSDWSSVVHRSAWRNIDRLGLWTGGSDVIPQKTDPSGSFAPVAAGSLGRRPVYVVVHGWAPGYRKAVDDADGRRAHWWGHGITSDHRWASDWCWSPVDRVGPTGMVQQIHAHTGGTADVVAYSWIDDSATDGGWWTTPEVYRSEAYTHLNGLRLADALGQALGDALPTAEIHLIGHSHGSRVCTVAALALQAAGHDPASLAILDSPEGDIPLYANGANLLGVHLDRMRIQDPIAGGAGTYVDNHASYFGVTYVSDRAGSPVERVVDVALHPSHLYWDGDIGDAHTYAAAWYAAAAAEAASLGDDPVGLDWPPAPDRRLTQRWPLGDPWVLEPGQVDDRTYVYGTPPLDLAEDDHVGPAHYADGELVLRPSATAGAYTAFRGRYWGAHWHQYGIVFDLEWPDPRPGDLVAVTIGNRYDGVRYTLLVLDGDTTPAGTRTTVAVNSTVYGEADLSVALLGDPRGRGVRLSSFRWVRVDGSHHRPH